MQLSVQLFIGIDQIYGFLIIKQVQIFCQLF